MNNNCEQRSDLKLVFHDLTKRYLLQQAIEIDFNPIHIQYKGYGDRRHTRVPMLTLRHWIQTPNLTS